MSSMNHLLTSKTVFLSIGSYLYELRNQGDPASAEQQLIALMDQFPGDSSARFLVAPAIIADDLVINVYDKLTGAFAGRVSADRAIEEYLFQKEHEENA